MKKFTNKILLISVCLSLLGIAGFHQSPYGQPTSNQNPAYFAPSKLIKYFAFGFPDFYADLLWIRLLQNIDFCSQQIGLPVYDGIQKYQCEEGWSYKIVDAITELSPRFLKAYQVSASIMSVIMRDKQGAKKIYDKGIKQFPTDWRLHHGAAYHYLIEMQDRGKAADLLMVAARHGGPQWLYALAAQQYGHVGQSLFAKSILEDFLKQNPNNQYKIIIEKRLKKINQQIQELNHNSSQEKK